ncbi:TetR/AcrR family transcriptional regulator [Vogesella sp. LIG4]|uniref:TetR/AcrR family transcriptional regulator n=1 Tax=Vogesella sp. LIG4 TaxID=1192162 RepID=UPI00081FF230|nr:TetR/AcrR family transcriptional regulator [Vogesella sp. LIG4]SCK25722.1 transcriptional regulator, TetR family [Vogesella sp. LIG4]
MARPRSEEKQLALLEAATTVVASQGLGAPTSQIARQAGVAEGTLFRYFPTKDDLLNELYVHLKRNLGEALQQASTPPASLDAAMQLLWNNYIDWGIANPEAIKALSQLAVSDRISDDTRNRVSELLPGILETSRAFIARSHLAALPAGFADAIFMALADTTMRFAAADPAQSEAYKAAGFKVLQGTSGS